MIVSPLPLTLKAEFSLDAMLSFDPVRAMLELALRFTAALETVSAIGVPAAPLPPAS